MRRSRRVMVHGLLICLFGVVAISVSYFALPLYAHLEGGDTITAWEWVSGLVYNMQLQGVSPTFLFGICWVILPLVAAAFVGLLGIARTVSNKPFVGTLYLITCGVGSLALALTLFLVVYGLRLGALGEAIGYTLCFLADRSFRSAQHARTASA